MQLLVAYLIFPVGYYEILTENGKSLKLLAQHVPYLFFLLNLAYSIFVGRQPNSAYVLELLKVGSNVFTF